MDSILSPEYGLIFWTLVSVLVVFFLLRKYAWKPILGALEERETSIEVSLQQAEKAREEMAKLTADNQKLLNEAKEERAKIIKEAKELGDKLVAEAKDKAAAEYGKKVAEATREIENQKLAAIAEVKNQAGTLAISIAEKLLKKELSNKPAQEALASELVDEFKLN
jgi:F-type H+-transporting ATPase subunit b